jgi:polysaccharide biosynthesis transport protein
MSLRDSDVHIIPSGAPMAGALPALDSDSINFLLDALDDVYDHIVVVSQEEPARNLFEAMQGRFDCGVTLGGEAPGKSVAKPGIFLGFEVDGISLFTLESQPAKPLVKPAKQRFAHAS